MPPAQLGIKELVATPKIPQPQAQAKALLEEDIEAINKKAAIRFLLKNFILEKFGLIWFLQFLFFDQINKFKLSDWTICPKFLKTTKTISFIEFKTKINSLSFILEEPKKLMKFLAALLTIIALFTLNNCSDKNLKNTIAKEVNSQFLSQSKNINTNKPADDWWLEFNDDLLNQLIAIGLKNNKDLQISSLNIVTARQLNNINITDLLPAGKISLQRQRFASPVFGPNGVKYDIYQALFDASWELDFFGKNLDRYKSGKMRFLKETEIYKANALRVSSEIAQNYFALKATQKQISNLSEILEIKKELSAIATQKESNGTYSKINLYQAKIDFEKAASDLTFAKSNEKLLTYRLAVLLGATPEKTLQILSDAKNNKQIFDYYSGIVPVGLKSDILKNRPDILAAEYEIDAAIYDKSAQIKEFLPSFNLTASVGGGTKDLGEVLKHGAGIKNINGGVSLPFFAIGELTQRYKITKAKAKIAVLDYEKTVLNAVADAESQLTRYVDSLAIEENFSNARIASAKILKINQNKKSVGAISKEELLNSKVSDLAQENLLAQKKSETLTNLIALHKSIGGGFLGYKMKFEKDRVFLDKE